MGVDPLRSPPCPLGGKEGKSPTSFGKKLQYLGKFQTFRHPTESKKCSSALFPPRLPPSKAPLSTARSWVQFLVMTEWKILFSQKDFNFFRHQTESNICSSALFPSRLPPSKAPLSTGRSWVQSLVMTEWKNLIFSENFTFSDFRPGCNKFCWGPGRTSLHRDWPLPKSPLPPGGKRGKFPHPFRAKHCYISKSSNFFDFRPRAICVRLLFFVLDYPLRKHPCQLGGHEFNS